MSNNMEKLAIDLTVFAVVVIGLIVIGIFIYAISVPWVIPDTPSRLELIEKNANEATYYDKETRVMYLVLNNPNYANGITVLVDAEGQPILYNE